MEMCKYAVPEWKEVEEGHFCACHLYNGDEENARANETVKEAKRTATVTVDTEVM